MQEKDYIWFLDNYSRIHNEYGDSFVVVKNKKVIGSYKTYKDALIKTIKEEKIGSFIIQECGKSKEKSTICTISSII